MKKRKRAQFNFVWIFAILAGGSILALAIWGAVQGGDILRYSGDSEAGLSISILTDPLQADFSEASFGKISFQQETRINNICIEDGRFGKNDISVSTKSGVGNAWNMPGGATSIYNKYIFSSETSEGFEFGVFSKSFDFPYKVSDLVFLMSGRYCFLGAPEEIVDEVLGLGIENIVISAGGNSGEPENCSFGDEIVCFGGGSNCDSIVYGSCLGNCDSVYDYGVVSKKDGDLKYVGNLMWGAIFSDKKSYDCNVDRLVYRAARIGEIYSYKAELMDARDCGTNLRGDLVAWVGMLDSADGDDLVLLKNSGDNLDKKNNREVCGLW